MQLHKLRQHSIKEIKNALGTKRRALLEKLGIESIYDLLLYIPRGYEDRTNILPLSAAFGTVAVATKVEVVAHDYIGWGSKRTLRVHISDGQSEASLLCFGRHMLATVLGLGVRIYLWASFNNFRGAWQSSRFEFEVLHSPQEEARGSSKSFMQVIPVYPALGKFPLSIFRSLIKTAVQSYVPSLAPDLPDFLIEKYHFMHTGPALIALHQPTELKEAERARRSLAYRELFLLQARICASKNERIIRKHRSLGLNMQQELIASLPFALTTDQELALKDINADLQAEYPMLRLLQGDVGCGKTLVAILAALALCEEREQVVILAPTTLLARQHAKTASQLLGNLDLRIDLLHSALSTKERSRVIADIASGENDIIIGTHSLLSDKIDFHRLGLIVIDEQQRFGVKQRGKLLQGQAKIDTLIMTATPIPRTLALSMFGHMELSSIKTMPPGRQSIKSHLARIGKEEKVYSFVERELAAGRQAYFVYPWIEGNSEEGRKGAEGMKETLRSRFQNYQVELLHSRVEEEEQHRIMNAFYSGDIAILLATSVVEVGVDVPNASCIVVEHSERFGLATLHQLRGRVGRGSHPSYAFFIYDGELTDDARARLQALYENSSGFVLAEKDLAIRGPGEFEGMRQAGYLHMEVARLRWDLDILMHTHQDCAKIFKEDPHLQHPKHAIICSNLSNVQREFLA